AATGKNLLSFNGFEPRLTPFQNGSWTLAPDGKVLATVDGVGQNGKLWDVSTGKLLRSLDMVQDPMNNSSLTFTPDGKLLAIPGNEIRNNLNVGVIHLWDVATGQMVRTLEAVGPKGDAEANVSLNNIVFSADGSLVVASGNGDGRNDLVFVW